MRPYAPVGLFLVASCKGPHTDAPPDSDHTDAVDSDSDTDEPDTDDTDDTDASDTEDRDADGVSRADGDCDDTDASVNPGAVEVCDGIDQDCDGDIDDGTETTWFADDDGDGFGNVAVSTAACAPSTGLVSDATDCDDADPAAHPGAIDGCDPLDIDLDCDPSACEQFAGSFWSGTGAVVPDVPSLQLSSITVEAWISGPIPPDNTSRSVVSKGDPTTGSGYRLALFGGVSTCGVSFVAGPTAVVWNVTFPCDGGPHHVVGQYDVTSDTISCGVDGKVYGTPSGSLGQLYVDGTGDDLLFASGGGALWYDGLLDEVRISSAARYPRTFTPDRHFTVDATTVGLWRFDEGAGTLVEDWSPTGADALVWGVGFGYVPEF